ncbi:archaeal proteasome endopeptidase complex subunit beta [Candidatus Bathyarchaeota archaeon]|nr:archaeal proteasome endopeptidase complex subunit beta [Candidatus Bathyarchaeota archaeon]MCK4435792.1 archaeal proteasome endopeptidase complex subunit beta [Candidatus Bathyarchaeota archaeon]
MRETSNPLVYKGTTTIGVVCNDGIILSSDTRVTMGTFIAHKKGKKIYKIDDHVAMTISGSVADAQRLVDILVVNARLYKIDFRRPIPIKSASRLLSNLLFSSRYYPLLAQIIVGGIDNSGHHVFSLDPLGSLVEEKCVSTGSGSPVAYGVLEDKFQEGMPTAEMLPVVVHALKAAMKRNTASGDSFDIAIIDKNGYRELADDEKASIVETTSELRRKE